MSAFKTATAIWLWVMAGVCDSRDEAPYYSLLHKSCLDAAFEVVAITRVLVLRESIEAVVPLFSVANAHSQTFVEAWVFIAATLCVVRASQALDVNSSGAWRITALVHILELVYHGFNSIVTERAFSAQVVPPTLILAGVVINAIWFTAAWVLSGSPAKGKRSE